MNNDKQMTDDQELSNVITLTDESGNDIEFEFLGVVDFQGKEYLVLADMNSDDEEIYTEILEIEPTDEDDETEQYITVEDEKILDAVFTLFKEENKDKYEFVD